MSTQQTPTEGTKPDILARLISHRAVMAPHQKERYAGKLLLEAITEIESLREVIRSITTLDEDEPD